MDYKQVKQEIKQALKGVFIPAYLKEESNQVAWTAHLEGIHIKSAVKRWVKDEMDFTDRLKKGADVEFALEDADCLNRRLDNTSPKFIGEQDGDEIEMYEK